MELEITPEPSDEERRALLAALAESLDRQRADPRGEWGRDGAAAGDDE
jgi:hypothetical protein